MIDSSLVPELEREPRPVRMQLLRIIPVVLVLGLLVHFVLPRLGSVADSIDALHTMKPWAIVLAIVFETLCYVANGALLQSVVHLTGEHVSLRRAAVIEMGAGTVSLVAAGALGFGAAIYRWTRDSGVSRDAAMLASWLPPVFDSITLVLFALIGAVELLRAHQLSRTTETALAIVIAVLSLAIGTIIVLLVRSDWMTAIALRITRLIKRVRPGADDSLLIDAADRAARAWRTMRSGGWVRPACSSLLVMTFDFLCLRYAFLAAGQHLYITTLLAGYGVPLLLGRSTFLPGGIAVTEVAMAAIFGGLGVPAGAAVVAVLTYRLISFWLPAMIGIPIAIALQSGRSRTSTVET
jgi:glycosyltransferase 2 family protein